MSTASLQHEIGKRHAFDSRRQEAFLNLIRTADVLSSQVEHLLRAHSLSSATYNVLRIVRAGGSEGVPCSTISSHLITQVPDVTRLVDRLERDSLVTRQRSEGDRRVIRVRITAAGRRKLDRLDPKVMALHEAQFAGLSDRDLDTLNALLTAARKPPHDTHQP